MRYLIPLIALFLTSCNSNEREIQDHNDLEQISIDVSKSEEIMMSDFFDSIDYVSLKTPDNDVIGRIRKIVIQDDYMAFLDQAKNSIWIHTAEGEYVNEVAIPVGRGPGELEQIEDIVFTGNNEIHALGAFKIVVYEMDGEYQREIPFRFFIYRFTYDEDSKLYIGYAANSLNDILDNTHSGKNLIVFNNKGEIVDSFLPIPEGRQELGYLVPNKFPTYNGETLFFPHLVDTVYTITSSGASPKYALDYGDYSVTDEVFARRSIYDNSEHAAFEFTENELWANDYVSNMTFFNETDAYIFFRIGVGRTQYNVIYDKNKKESKVGPMKFVNDMDFGFVPNIYASSDTALYSIIEAGDLIRQLNDLYENEPEKYAQPNTQNLVRLARSVSENSNPILQIATFKE